nr:MAG TPA: hypothetical protein [Caudoviricetes sp.]
MFCLTFYNKFKFYPKKRLACVASSNRTIG